MAAMQALVVLAADVRLPCGAAYLTVCEARELLLARLPLRALRRRQRVPRLARGAGGADPVDAPGAGSLLL